MTQVTPTLTPSTAAEVAGALVWARGPSAPASQWWLLPLAQSALETGNWKSMYDWNVGFTALRASPDYFTLGSNPNHFDAFTALGDGCKTFVGWLGKHGALASADAGDLNAYVSTLKAGNYAGPSGYDAYQAGLASLAKTYAGVTPIPYSPPEQPLVLRPATSPWPALLGAAAIVGAAGAAAYALRGMRPVRRRAYG